MIKKIYYKYALPILRDLYTQGFTHPFTWYVKDTLGNDLVGVEIGVFKGENAKNMLNVLSIKKLYLVDPYELYNDDSCSSYQMDKNSNNIELQAKKRLRNNSNIEFLKKKSIDAVDDIPNDLDFVYIDGDHSYEGTKIDIIYYWPKVKIGGIIGGDDFTLGHVGLIRAVIEFVNNNNLKLEGTKENWWVIKR